MTIVVLTTIIATMARVLMRRFAEQLINDVIDGCEANMFLAEWSAFVAATLDRHTTLSQSEDLTSLATRL